MAEEAKPQKSKPRIRKTPETVRERADKQTAKKHASPSKLKTKIHRPLSTLRKIGSKEYNPIPLPDNKLGRVLNTRVRLVPKFIREAWAELRQVTWPTKKEAVNLTLAVFIFAIFFTVIIQLLDLVFNKLVKEIFIK